MSSKINSSISVPVYVRGAEAQAAFDTFQKLVNDVALERIDLGANAHNYPQPKLGNCVLLIDATFFSRADTLGRYINLITKMGGAAVVLIGENKEVDDKLTFLPSQWNQVDLWAGLEKTSQSSPLQFSPKGKNAEDLKTFMKEPPRKLSLIARLGNLIRSCFAWLASLIWKR